MRPFACLALLFLLPLPFVYGQTHVEVEILRAESMRPFPQAGNEVLRLLGDVLMGHGDARMRCDSAYFYSATNSFDAFGRVHIDNREVKIDGDTLFYDGNSGEGRIVGRIVVLRDTAQDATLWSDQIFFNTSTNTARYVTWGRIRSGENNLRSHRGYYFSDTKVAAVAHGVTFKGEKVDAYGDSVQYHQEVERMYFWGPTRLYQEQKMAYGLEGWYDQLLERVEIRRDVMLDNGGERLFADWAYADQKEEFSEAKGNVVLEDSLSNNRLYTKHLRYWHNPQRGLADVEPMLFSIDTTSTTRDSLYLRADLLRFWSEPYEQITDSLATRDTLYFFRAEGLVKVYRSDIQAIADTLYYNGQDSTVHLRREPYPFVWSGEMQGSSREMIGYLGSEQLDSLYMNDRVLVASRDDSTHYNQMAGMELWGYFEESELRRISVQGDGQVIFFLRDEDDLIGVNRVECPYFVSQIEDNEPVEIMFYSQPVSTITPIQDAEREDRELFGFAWREDLRPQSPIEVMPAWIESLDFYLPLKRSALGYRLEEGPKVQVEIDVQGEELPEIEEPVERTFEGVR